MKPILMLISMLFLHVFADFHLQGILANMKQRKWWEKRIKNFENSSYINDYRISLGAHAFEWAFMMMLPCGIASWCCIQADYSWKPVFMTLFYALLVLLNMIAHYCIDNAKANKNEINLVGDQILHIMQVLITWTLWTIVIGW